MLMLEENVLIFYKIEIVLIEIGFEIFLMFVFYDEYSLLRNEVKREKSYERTFNFICPNKRIALSRDFIRIY